MLPQISRWLVFGLLITWALSHATVFGQQSGKSAAPDKLRQGLDKVVTIDYSGQSLAEIMNHFKDKTGVNVTFDTALLQMGINPHDNVGQFTFKATAEKASQALRRLLGTYHLTYIVSDGAVMVTTEEMALYRQMSQRVSVDVEDVPFKKAVRELAKSNGINLVIDPKMNLQIDTPVTLQVENTGVETALRLLAELANLKAVRMGNVMFVTSDEKAKKIREEEQHQFDNPFNPNLPAMGIQPGMMNRVGVAIGGAGFAIPAFAGPPALPPGIPVPPPMADPAAPVEAPRGEPGAPPVKKETPPAPPPGIPAPPVGTPGSTPTVIPQPLGPPQPVPAPGQSVPPPRY